MCARSSAAVQNGSSSRSPRAFFPSREPDAVKLVARRDVGVVLLPRDRADELLELVDVIAVDHVGTLVRDASTPRLRDAPSPPCRCLIRSAVVRELLLSHGSGESLGDGQEELVELGEFLGFGVAVRPVEPEQCEDLQRKNTQLRGRKVDC